MNISKLSRDPRAIKALTGLSYQEFSNLVPLFESSRHDIQMEKQDRKRKAGGGRKGVLHSTEIRLFFILFYLKTYPTFDVMAFLFGMQRGHACEAGHFNLHILERSLGRKIVLPERKINSVEEFLEKFPEAREVFFDGVERRINRPKKPKNQNKTYSGKKKAHTRKNVVIVNSKKRVLVLSPTKSGRRHDKRIADKFSMAERIPESVLIGADSGFQGIQHMHHNTWLPHKGTKKRPLTDKQREDNCILAHFRVCVEHAISGMKRFRAFSDVFRNRLGHLSDQVALLSAGLWNYHLSYSA
jgi:DDE superfamily endonuclease/Helix-turn-helix of DDE superfamily endonuclease